MKYVRFLAWPVAGLTIALAIVTASFTIAAPLRGDSFFDVLGNIPMVVMAAVGGLVASRRPRHPVGWLFAGTAAAFISQGFAQRYARYAVVGHHHVAGAHLAAWYGVWSFMPGFGFLGIVLMLFPSGRALSRVWRAIAGASFAVIALVPFASLPMLADRTRSLLFAESPSSVHGGAVVGGVGQLGLQVVFGLGIVALAVRWFRSRGIERLQMKWFVLGALMIAVSVVMSFVIGYVAHTDDPISTPLGATTQLLALCAVSIAAGIAVLRYRLADIDRIISRTVAYVLVTGVLAAVYVLLAIVPPSLAGSGGVPSWLIAVVTLLVAVLFRPLQRRVQAIVDRRFNRARYNAAQTIDSFTSRLRDDIDLDALQIEVREVVHRTMQPRHVSLWLRG